MFNQYIQQLIDKKTKNEQRIASERPESLGNSLAQVIEWFAEMWRNVRFLNLKSDPTRFLNDLAVFGTEPDRAYILFFNEIGGCGPVVFHLFISIKNDELFFGQITQTGYHKLHYTSQIVSSLLEFIYDKVIIPDMDYLSFKEAAGQIK